MSYTFTAEPGQIEGYAFACGHPHGVTSHRLASWDEAFAFLSDAVRDHGSSGPLAVCGDPQCVNGHFRLEIKPVETDPAEPVQVAMSNGRLLLRHLGLDEYGSADPDLFLSRVLLAKAEITGGWDRSHAASFGWPHNPGHGYLREKCGRLEELAQFAADRSRNVTWS